MIHQKRSVQVPNPENRVLFELTTISNELNRDNMTTVQTTLIPNSGRSNKQVIRNDQDLRRDLSAQARNFTTHDTTKPEGEAEAI